MKLTVCGPYVRLILTGNDGDAGREDVLLAAESARLAADGLDGLAALAAKGRAPALAAREPAVEVLCVVSRGKPLVRWVFGWRAAEMLLTPAHARALAALTRRAAAEAGRAARWAEERDPAMMVR